MKQTKRILSVVLCLLMLVAVVPVMETSAASFVPRLTAPTREGYYGTENNYNPFTTNEDAGNGNCTWYAWGRAYELLGSRPQLSTGNASTWFPRNQSNGTYSYGSTPRLGAIACWSGGSTGAGHVAVVEQINDNGSFVISESSWSAKNWWFNTQTLNANGYHSSSLSFQGFIYIGDFEPISEVFVSTNKKHYSPNETATWSFDAEDANSVHLYIYKDGNKYFEGQFATNASYSRQLTTNGHYAFYIVAHYSSGDVSSAWNDCNVSELNAYESSGRTLFYTGETVNFKFSATFANSVHLYIYKDGEKFFEGQFKTSDTYSRIITDTGHYSYYIVAHYDTGNEAGVWKDFDVVLPSVRTDKQAYQIGDTVEFSFNSNGANSLHLYIYKDGKKFFEGQFLPSSVYKRALDSVINYVGDYYCYIISHYDSGNYQSENHMFSVKSDHTHSYTSSITKSATCSTTGIRTFTCSCGDSYTETIPVNTSNHVNTTNTAATASTCTVKGYTAGVYCNDCKKYISGHAEQPLAAHQTTTQNAKAATCTAEGYTGDQVCTVCKQTITKGTAIAKKAHSLTTVNQKAAGCTTAGYTGDQYCTTCNQTISRGSATNALGHTSPDSNGNCTRCGTHIKDVTSSQPSNPQPNPNACKYCGKVHTGPFGWLIKFFHSILAIFKR